MQELDFSHVLLQPDEVDMVIYHGNCSDGFTAALCAYNYFQDKSKEIVYFPASFYKPIPFEEVKSKNVLMLDFSYKLRDLKRLISLCNKFLILDHHIGAEEDLKQIPDNLKLFDMKHSGAYLAYRYFNRTGPIPMMITYVEDNDIWLKKQFKTEEFTAYMYTLDFTFEEYNKLMDENFIRNDVFVLGAGMVKQNESIIKREIKNASPKFVCIGDKYYFVAHLNATVLKSELGNRVFQKLPNINFAAIYSIQDRGNTTVFSLRSLDTATDVQKIANIFGGNGHRNASGCSTCNVTNNIPTQIIDSSFATYQILTNIKLQEAVINEEKFNIILLNTALFKKELGKYLLQVRYTNKDGKPIQESMSILNQTSIDVIRFSVMWSYNGISDKIDYLITFHDLIYQSCVRNYIFKNTYMYFNFYECNDVFMFSSSGSTLYVPFCGFLK